MAKKKDQSPPWEFSWTRRERGYEVSTLGDRRFSAFNAKMQDGRSIEVHYQCDVKGYQPGGHNWRLGKGKPPLNPQTDLWQEYLSLWRSWASLNPSLMQELKSMAAAHNYTLKDTFASSQVNQARALAVILTEMYFPAKEVVQVLE